ncbi:RDD family protein [Nocardia sp. NPDC058176]|uniref:RDD family protein n=1 Tax=Nocardia sp. NPDC058176 TaxID=3346368 RepID=UPI0036DB5773
MTLTPAPFFRRLVARVLDLTFCLGLTFVVAIPVGIVYAFSHVLVSAGWMRDWSAGIYAAACYFIAYVGLEVFLLTRREGQTLGKGLMGLRVVPSAPWSRPRLELRPALTRMSMIFMPFVLMSLSGNHPDVVVLEVLSLIGMASIAFNLLLTALPLANRRALHDYAAGTRVVRAKRRKIEIKKDLPMLLPKKISFAKN